MTIDLTKAINEFLGEVRKRVIFGAETEDYIKRVYIGTMYRGARFGITTDKEPDLRIFSGGGDTIGVVYFGGVDVWLEIDGKQLNKFCTVKFYIGDGVNLRIRNLFYAINAPHDAENQLELGGFTARVNLIAREPRELANCFIYDSSAFGLTAKPLVSDEEDTLTVNYNGGYMHLPDEYNKSVPKQTWAFLLFKGGKGFRSLMLKKLSWANFEEGAGLLMDKSYGSGKGNNDEADDTDPFFVDAVVEDEEGAKIDGVYFVGIGEVADNDARYWRTLRNIRENAKGRLVVHKDYSWDL